MVKICKIDRIAVIGAGRVGTTFAYAALLRNLVTEIVLIDVDSERCAGEVMDLAHGLSHVDSGRVIQGTFKDAASANIIVITAGAAQKPEETRLALIKKNAAIVQDILKHIGKINTSTILIMVTNPVDALTYVAQKCCNLPAKQVFGSGTDLDSSRLQYLLSQHLKVNPRSIEAYIIGEHGDSELAVWSSANIAGVPLKKMSGYSAKVANRCFNQTKNAAYEIIKRKGATFYAIGMALVEICEAVMKDQHLVLPVSTLLKNYHGVSGVCLAAPCVIGRRGVEKIITLPLSATEKRQFKTSARLLKKTLKQIEC